MAYDYGDLYRLQSMAIGPPKLDLASQLFAIADNLGRRNTPQAAPEAAGGVGAAGFLSLGGASVGAPAGNYGASAGVGTPASIRYNNPGAQYPSAEAGRYGQTGYGIIGGGHKIASFPDPVSGAAANFDLLNRNYTGMSIGEAGRKWTGSYGFGIPGYNPRDILSKGMLDNPDTAIPIMKAIARREAGQESPLTDAQWLSAWRKFKGMD